MEIEILGVDQVLTTIYIDIISEHGEKIAIPLTVEEAITDDITIERIRDRYVKKLEDKLLGKKYVIDINRIFYITPHGIEYSRNDVIDIIRKAIIGRKKPLRLSELEKYIERI